MNKSELIEAISKSADISKAASEKALDGALNAIRSTLKKNSSVTLVGFGTFKVGKRDKETCNEFCDDLAKRMSQRIQLSADAMNAYLEGVGGA